jgi:RimJ/RimL family protein N-acetyltransferase
MDVLATPRLVLRRARITDLSAMHAVLSNPQAMRYWATPPHETLDQTQAWIEAMIAADPAESDDFIVEHEGRAIGKAGLWRVPEIGFILSPDMWGRGFATEALAAIISRVFARFAMDAITADVDPRNAASLRVLEKAGFVETGRAPRTLQVGGEWCDSVYLKRWR